MTNNGVGKVYEKVIQAVIDTSVTDFQDSGVDVSTLEELKKAWQEKLTAFNVAQFPWDPEKEVPAPKVEETDGAGEIAADGMPIKPDPDAELPPPPPPVPLGQPLSDPSIAAARAAQKVEKKFGPGVTNQQRNTSLPSLMFPSAPKPQTDGPDDDIMRHQADEEIKRIVLEGEEIRTQEDAIGEAMRRFNIQSDVMQVRPLNKKRKASRPTRNLDDESDLQTPGPSTAPQLPQTDGPDMDDDVINSDLDDTDEEPVDDDDDGEGIPQIMLCMYDKVQRTKNKWKCVLKDGILTVNGKEYVFRKANGEYEW